MPQLTSMPSAAILTAHSTVTASIYPSVAWWDGTLALRQAGTMLTRWASSEFSTDWGTRDISERTPFYDPISYHQGSVWPLFTGWVSLAEYRAGRPLSGYAHLMQNAGLTWAQDLGSVTELLSGEFFQPLGRSSAHQTWSSAMVISPALRGLFGLDWDVPNRTLRLAPKLPADWNEAKLHNVPFGSSRLEVQYERKADRLVVRTLSDQPEVLCLRDQLTAAPPCAAAPAKVHSLELPLPPVELAIPHQLPPQGSTTRQLKVLDEKEGSFTLAAQGGSVFELPVRVNRAGAKIEGAERIGDKIRIRFPEGEGYRTPNREVHLVERFSALAVCAAAAASAAGLFFGNGLHPIWWLMWIAPIPVLCLAPRVSSGMAFSAASVAWILGGLNTWTYYRELRIPLPVVILVAFLVPGLVFGLAVLFFRFFVRRNLPWAAALALPCTWVTLEYLNNLTQGTYQNLAYTQMDCLPLLQLGAVTGLWGISFAVLLFSSTLAAWAAVRGRQSRALGLTVLAIFAAIFAFGLWRLGGHPAAGAGVTVGLVGSDLPQNSLPDKPAEAMRLLQEYASQSSGLAERGAKIVLLPEMTAVVGDSLMGQVDELFSSTARSTGMQILVPVIHSTAAGRYNEARLYSSSGVLEATYRKQHLVPVYEDLTHPGTELTILHQPAGVLGIEICKDMDYLDPARRYGASGIGLLLVPAFDFKRDGWLHGRMAIMRGVENGFHIARVAKNGIFTVSDTRGRVLSEVMSSTAPFATLVATAGVDHVPTLYTVWGDWFAWLNCAALVALLVFGASVRRRPTAA